MPNLSQPRWMVFKKRKCEFDIFTIYGFYDDPDEAIEAIKEAIKKLEPGTDPDFENCFNNKYDLRFVKLDPLCTLDEYVDMELNKNEKLQALSDEKKELEKKLKFNKEAREHLEKITCRLN